MSSKILELERSENGSLFDLCLNCPWIVDKAIETDPQIYFAEETCTSNLTASFVRPIHVSFAASL